MDHHTSNLFIWNLIVLKIFLLSIPRKILILSSGDIWSIVALFIRSFESERLPVLKIPGWNSCFGDSDFRLQLNSSSIRWTIQKDQVTWTFMQFSPRQAYSEVDCEEKIWVVTTEIWYLLAFIDKSYMPSSTSH
jgi:hypothetical protein